MYFLSQCKCEMGIWALQHSVPLIEALREPLKGICDILAEDQGAHHGRGGDAASFNVPSFGGGKA